MAYKARADSTVNQKYYWRNPNNMFDTVFGLERHYPGWIAIDMMTDNGGTPVLIKAYEPDTAIDPEPIPIPEPVKQKTCKFKDTCPFYTV